LPVVAVAAGTRIARHSTGRWLGGFVGGFVVLLVVVFMATMAATSGVVATHVGPAGQFLPNAKTGLAPDEQAQAARALGVADEVKAPPLAVLDGRIVSRLAWMGDAHRVEVTALRHDHGTYTVEGNRSNHADGRAMDIGAVDGHPCIETWGAPPDWGSACGRMVRALTRLSAPLRPTELIYCWDPDGPSDSRGFARSDHCNHIHVGFDAG
jgi:hypothetical protein